MPITRRAFMLSGLVSLPAMAALPQFDAGAGNRLELRAAPARQLLMPGREPTAVLAYNGHVPGPLIRTRRGEAVRIRFVNAIEEASTVHWHGLRIANSMDGVPGMTQDPVLPGGSFDYTFTPPDAGTFWYHPHRSTSQQLARGLYGPLIVDGDADGVFDDDITLVLDDWRLSDDGSISETFGNPMDLSHAGRLGNWMTANGMSLPDIAAVAGHLVRLRLINASNARVLYLDLQALNGVVIALDGQPLKTPFPGIQAFPLAPSQRVDVAVRLAAEGRIPFRESSGEPFTFANFVVAPGGSTVPDRKLYSLVENSLAEPDEKTATRHVMHIQGGMMGPPFMASVGNMDHGSMTAAAKHHSLPKLDQRELAGLGIFWALSGVAGTDEKPFLTAKRGEHILLTLTNETAWPHAMHIHGHHFRVLRRNGRPEQWMPWRDTVLMDRDEMVEIAFVADNPGKWMIHCHMIEHQISGMMTWMLVA